MFEDILHNIKEFVSCIKGTRYKMCVIMNDEVFGVDEQM